MKILNLYAGIGGNRKLWGDEHEITAIENNKSIARAYQEFNKSDKVIVTDAHKYLLEHFKGFDFIWSSPPCPTHSRIRKYTAVERGQNEPVYPDMKLYEEILFLQGYFKGIWVVENVISWYEPLIKPYIYREHYYWANFIIDGKRGEDRKHNAGNEELSKLKGFDLSELNYIKDKTKVLRNCVEPKAGLHIFQAAFKKKQKTMGDFEKESMSSTIA